MPLLKDGISLKIEIDGASSAYGPQTTLTYRLQSRGGISTGRGLRLNIEDGGILNASMALLLKSIAGSHKLLQELEAPSAA